MVKINIEIVTTDREGHVKQKATLSSAEFVQLKALINNISETAELEEQPIHSNGFISGSELEKIFNNFKRL